MPPSPKLPDPSSFKRRILDRAREIGFDLVGVAPPGPFAEHEHYLKWLETGLHGEMAYMAKNRDGRRDVRSILPSARSVLVCALNYHTDHPLSTESEPASGTGWISRYAWGDDYHDVVKSMLFELVEYLRELAGPGLETKVYVDTGPVSDRILAYHAGLGWFAKNTMIIHPKLGSWFFLGNVINNLPLEPDGPMSDHCGTCTLCLEACPTRAFPSPRVLDSRRCISYLTIEVKEELSEDARSLTGRHVFGCDICQDVCPWNRKAPVSAQVSFQPREGNLAPNLEDLLDLDPESFNARFRKSPLKRPKWKGFIRNVLLAAGSLDGAAWNRLKARIVALASSSDSTVSRTAAWVLSRRRDSPPC